MKTIIKSISLLVAFLALHSNVHARGVEPIVDYDDVPVVTGSGKPATAEQVRDAIMAAGASNQWQVSKSAAPDLLSASLSSKGKHSVLVSIPYSAGKFSIKYQDSINMKYRLAEPSATGNVGDNNSNPAARPIPSGTRMIHPYYNRWVQELLQSVKLELKKI